MIDYYFTKEISEQMHLFGHCMWIIKRLSCDLSFYHSVAQQKYELCKTLTYQKEQWEFSCIQVSIK